MDSISGSILNTKSDQSKLANRFLRKERKKLPSIGNYCERSTIERNDRNKTGSVNEKEEFNLHLEDGTEKVYEISKSDEAKKGIVRHLKKTKSASRLSEISLTIDKDDSSGAWKDGTFRYTDRDKEVEEDEDELLPRIKGESSSDANDDDTFSNDEDKVNVMIGNAVKRAKKFLNNRSDSKRLKKSNSGSENSNSEEIEEGNSEVLTQSRISMEHLVKSSKCPLCLGHFEKIITHVKACAAKNNITTVKLFDAVRLQRKQDEERAAIGLPVLLQPPKRIPHKKNATNSSTRRKMKRTATPSGNSNIDLAIALSASLREFHEKEVIKETEMLVEAGLEEEAENNMRLLEMIPSPAPSSSSSLGDNPQHRDRTQAITTLMGRGKGPLPVLLSRSQEDRERIMTEKVAIVFLEDDNKCTEQSAIEVADARLTPVIPKSSSLLTFHNKNGLSSGKRRSYCGGSKSSYSERKNSSIGSNLRLKESWRRLLGNMAMSDVTVIVKDDFHIPAHKLVFYARCPLILDDIKTLVSSDKSLLQSIIEWENIAREVAFAFLSYIYCNDKSKIQELCKVDAASLNLLVDRYNVEELKHLRDKIELQNIEELKYLRDKILVQDESQIESVSPFKLKRRKFATSVETDSLSPSDDKKDSSEEDSHRPLKMKIIRNGRNGRKYRAYPLKNVRSSPSKSNISSSSLPGYKTRSSVRSSNSPHVDVKSYMPEDNQAVQEMSDTNPSLSSTDDQIRDNVLNQSMVLLEERESRLVIGSVSQEAGSVDDATVKHNYPDQDETTCGQPMSHAVPSIDYNTRQEIATDAKISGELDHDKTVLLPHILKENEKIDVPGKFEPGPLSLTEDWNGDKQHIKVRSNFELFSNLENLLIDSNVIDPNPNDSGGKQLSKETPSTSKQSHEKPVEVIELSDDSDCEAICVKITPKKYRRSASEKSLNVCSKSISFESNTSNLFKTGEDKETNNIGFIDPIWDGFEEMNYNNTFDHYSPPNSPNSFITPLNTSTPRKPANNSIIAEHGYNDEKSFQMSETVDTHIPDFATAFTSHSNLNENDTGTKSKQKLELSITEEQGAKAIDKHIENSVYSRQPTKSEGLFQEILKYSDFASNEICKKSKPANMSESDPVSVDTLFTSLDEEIRSLGIEFKQTSRKVASFQPYLSAYENKKNGTFLAKRNSKKVCPSTITSESQAENSDGPVKNERNGVTSQNSLLLGMEMDLFSQIVTPKQDKQIDKHYLLDKPVNNDNGIKPAAIAKAQDQFNHYPGKLKSTNIFTETGIEMQPDRTGMIEMERTIPNNLSGFQSGSLIMPPNELFPVENKMIPANYEEITNRVTISDVGILCNDSVSPTERQKKVCYKTKNIFETDNIIGEAYKEEAATSNSNILLQRSKVESVQTAVTPRPDFSKMRGMALLKEIQKYGLKPSLAVNKARMMLSYIYSQTHPLVPTDLHSQGRIGLPGPSINPTVISAAAAGPGRAEQGPSADKIGAIFPDSFAVESNQLLGDADNSSCSDDLVDFIAEKSLRELFEDEAEADIGKTKHVAGEALRSVVINYLKENFSVYGNVIQYKEISLENLLNGLKKQKYRFNPKGVMEILDKENIAYQHPYNLRKRKLIQQCNTATLPEKRTRAKSIRNTNSSASRKTRSRTKAGRPEQKAPDCGDVAEAFVDLSFTNKYPTNNEDQCLDDGLKTICQAEEENCYSTYMELVELENRSIILNMEPFECPICFVNYKQGEGVVLRDCLHTFCKTCLVQTVEHNDKGEVKCPFQDLSYSCPFTLQDREIKEILTSEMYERHLARTLSLAENSMRNSFHCKAPDCPGWCEVEDNVPEFQCPVCFSRNCISCQAIHAGKNCKEYQVDLEVLAETDVNAKKTLMYLQELKTNKKAINCPTCNVIIAKAEGCDWVQCTVCKTEICWATMGNRWGPKGPGDITGGCRCKVNGTLCHPKCKNCH